MTVREIQEKREKSHVELSPIQVDIAELESKRSYIEENLESNLNEFLKSNIDFLRNLFSMSYKFLEERGVKVFGFPHYESSTLKRLRDISQREDFHEHLLLSFSSSDNIYVSTFGKINDYDSDWETEIEIPLSFFEDSSLVLAYGNFLEENRQKNLQAKRNQLAQLKAELGEE